MRRPTCSSALNKTKLHPVKKPDFSQRSGAHDFTLKSMPLRSPPTALSRARQTEGIALVVVLLSAMILMVSLLAISATMTISSQRTTADQGLTLRAQYAAEAGLSRAKIGFSDMTYLIGKMAIPTTVNGSTLEAQVKNFCGSGKTYSYRPYSQWTAEEKQSGVPLCDVGSKNGNSQYSMFTSWIPASAYQTVSASSNQYWQDAFSPTSLRTAVKIQSENGLDAYYQVGYGIEPRATRVMVPNSWYRLIFDSASSTSVGYVQRTGSSQQLATKRINNESPEQVYIDIQRKSLSYYGQFFNQWPGVYMTGGETSDGPFHSNQPIKLLKYNGTYPHFLDADVSIVGSETQTWNGSYGYGRPATSAEKSQTFLGGEPTFSADVIDLPQNPYSLQRAAMGGDEADTESKVTKNETTAAYGKDLTSATSNQGVYYSSGTSTTSNTGTAFAGGIYVNGDAEVKLSTESGNQVITVTQNGVPTTFKKSSAGKWSVTELAESDPVCGWQYSNRYGWRWVCQPGQPTTKTKQLSNDFNGAIFVNGSVTSLGGDGSNTPDIAAGSQITLAATGDVTVKESYTYTDDPLAKPDAQNVFGLLTTNGNIIADGPMNQDLIMSGSLMATGKGKGVTANIVSKGLVNGKYPQMKIIGGQIVDSALVTEGTNLGYKTNFVYDKRLRNLVAPPFFPIEQSWTGDGSTVGSGYNNAIWQVVAEK